MRTVESCDGGGNFTPDNTFGDSPTPSLFTQPSSALFQYISINDRSLHCAVLCAGCAGAVSVDELNIMKVDIN